MTLDEAISIRQLQLCGREIAPDLLAEAIEVIKATASQMRPTKAKRRAEAKADQESRTDRGNRILLEKLRKCMPWWTAEWELAAQKEAARPQVTTSETWP